MTKKRFYIDKSGDFKDKQTGNIIVDFGYSLNAMECREILNLLNELYEENEHLKNRLKNVLNELYCKDRVLEENKISIECCDKND